MARRVEADVLLVASPCCRFGRQPGEDPEATLREHARVVSTVSPGETT